MNPWLSRRLIGWAHQGGPERGRSPGTVETMQHALDVGIHALEFDLHATVDVPPALVVHHDPVLAAAGTHLEISKTTLEELRKAKSDLATLDQVLNTFPKAPMTIEVKARAAAEAAACRLAKEVGIRPLIVTAFSFRTVRAVKKKAGNLDTAPALPTIIAFRVLSLLPFSVPIARKHVALQVPLRLDQVKYAKAIPVLRRLKVSTARFVRTAHEQDLAVHVWTLDDPDQINEALDAGADGIMSNCPSDLMPILRKRGSWQA